MLPESTVRFGRCKKRWIMTWMQDADAQMRDVHGPGTRVIEASVWNCRCTEVVPAPTVTSYNRS